MMNCRTGIRGFPPSSRQEELHAFAQRIAPESKGQVSSHADLTAQWKQV